MFALCVCVGFWVLGNTWAINKRPRCTDVCLSHLGVCVAADADVDLNKDEMCVFVCV